MSGLQWRHVTEEPRGEYAERLPSSWSSLNKFNHLKASTIELVETVVVSGLDAENIRDEIRRKQTSLNDVGETKSTRILRVGWVNGWMDGV